MGNYSCLVEYKELLDKGIISKSEYDEIKRKVLQGTVNARSESNNDTKVNAGGKVVISVLVVMAILFVLSVVLLIAIDVISIFN